jgi:Ca2+-binding RTX toxin-like protein
VNLGTGSANDGSGGTDALTSIEGIVGSRGNDTLTGSAEANLLEGDLGEDLLVGAAGNDTLLGGDGSDTLRGGADNDVLDGGANGTGAGMVDYADFSDATARVVVNLAQGLVEVGTAGEVDLLVNIEGVIGSAFDDTMTGSAGDDVFVGGAGNDSIAGGDGFDAVSYRSASAVVTVNLTNSSATGTSVGTDTLSSIEIVSGSDFNDTLTGSAGNDTLSGNGGNDTIDGSGGTDTAAYDFASAAVTVNLAVTTAQNTGGDGTDTLSNIENLRGSNFGDTLTGNNSNNTLDGRKGNDTVDGGNGWDRAEFAGADVNGGTLTLSTYDGIAEAFFVRQGSANVANIAWNFTQGGWQVTDLSVANAADGFGVDLVRNVEEMRFSFGTQSLLVNVQTGLISGFPVSTASTGDASAPSSTGATFSEATSGSPGAGSVTLNFSEAMKISALPANLSELQAFSLYKNPVPGADQSTPLGVAQVNNLGTQMLYIQTTESFSSGDVLRVDLRAGGGLGKLTDMAGNAIPDLEVWFGGNGANTINLADHYSMGTLYLRGNNGDDTLIGNSANNTIIDDRGADFVQGGRGADTIVLSETSGFLKDTVLVRPGDSVVRFNAVTGAPDTTGRDTLQQAASAPTTSGFDILSGAGTNDVLSLPSAAIAPNATNVDGVNVGGFSRHSVSQGIATLLDEVGQAVAVTSSNSSDALRYLASNFRIAGQTVALKFDNDTIPGIDSLAVFQDGGVARGAGADGSDVDLDDTYLRILNLRGIGAAVLSNTAAVNAVQLLDTQSPKVVAQGDLKIADQTVGLPLDFNEAVVAPQGGAADLAISFQINGTGPTYAPSSVLGEGTSLITVQATVPTLAATDWAVITYAGSTTSNALRDLAGNLLLADDDQGNPSVYTFVLDSDSANTINLSSRSVFLGGLDIQARGGDDTVFGTPSADQIMGGAGADSLSGGQGADDFLFEQGDSPELSFVAGTNSFSLTGATYTFAGGKAEVINDFGVGGDAILIRPILDGVTGAGWLSQQYMSTAPLPGETLGVASDQRFFYVQGDLGSNGVFTVGTNGMSGADTLVVYDGDATSGVSQTGFVIKGVKPSDFGQAGGGDAAIVSKISRETYIDWTADSSPATLAPGSTVSIRVHFTTPVTVDTASGNPTLALVITDDAGVSRTVQASYTSSTSPDFSSSLRFDYAVASGDSGRYVMDGINLNGAVITGPSGLADLTLNGINRTITSGNYIYGTSTSGLTGTSANDRLSPYMANATDAATVQSNGINNGANYNYPGVNGVDGNLDTLTVPVLLPSSVTSSTLAAGYALRYDPATATVSVIQTSNNTVVSGTTVSATFPTDVEALNFVPMYLSGSTLARASGEFTIYKNNFEVGPASVSTERFVQGSAGNDDALAPTQTSAEARNLIRGGTGNDAITGSAGRDALIGEGGANTGNGGDGNDQLFVGATGNDTMDGGAGIDRVVLTMTGQMMSIGSRISGFMLQAQTGSWTEGVFTASNTSNVYRVETSGNDLSEDSGGLVIRNASNNTPAMTATNVENLEVRLTSSDVRTTLPLILGDGSANTLNGTGMSIVNGLGGDDRLNASNNGFDVLFGGSGNDTLNGGTARDLMYGGTGDDSMLGNGGDDWFVGAAGNDTLNGGPGFDAAAYVVNNVVNSVANTSAMSFSFSAASNAILIMQGTVELARINMDATGPTSVVDVANSSGTGFGTDSISGVESLVFDFSSNSSSTSSLSLTFSSAGQPFSGSSSNENVIGLSGNDTIAGNGGNDRLLGLVGNDSLTGGGGNDAIDGGEGTADLAVYLGAHTGYTVGFANGVLTLTDGLGGDGMDTVSNVERFQFSDGYFVLDFSNGPVRLVPESAPQ